MSYRDKDIAESRKQNASKRLDESDILDATCVLNERRKLNSLLSLCKKAGQLVSGESKCENAIKKKKAKIVILSEYASKNTVKKFIDKTNYYNVPLYILDMSKSDLGGIIGESDRAVITIIGDDFIKELRICLCRFEYRGVGAID